MLILLFNFIIGRTQNAVFLHQGTISFEKRTNAYYFLKDEYDENSPFYNSYKERYPDFSTSTFSLHFNKGSSYYVPNSDKEPGMLNFIERVAGTNEVFTDFTTDSLFIKKSILGRKYTIAASGRKIFWKLAAEVRTIAGFKCHRVDGLILDSLYVIAYYTDQIPIPGGPESFGGLPGMILGVAIPRLHSTWFATQININDGRDFAKQSQLKTRTMSEKSFLSEIDQILDPKSKAFSRSVFQAKL